jgi:hypothetical protein
LGAGECEGLGVDGGGGFAADLLAGAQEGEGIGGVVGGGPDGAGATAHDDGDGGSIVFEGEGVDFGAEV